MKRMLSYILLLLLTLASLTSWANPEDDLLEFLDRSAEEMRIQVLKNEELVSLGRASEGVYFYALRYQYNGVTTVSSDKAIQLNQTFSTYRNKAIFVLMPLTAESETGRGAAMSAMQMYVKRVAYKLDQTGTRSVIGLCTVLGLTGDKYSFPIQVDGVSADQTVASNTKSVLQNVTCKLEHCYIDAYVSNASLAGMRRGNVKGDINTSITGFFSNSNSQCESRKVLLASKVVAEFNEADYSFIEKFQINENNILYEFIMNGDTISPLYNIDINSLGIYIGEEQNYQFVNWRAINAVAVEQPYFREDIHVIYFVWYPTQVDTIFKKVYYNIPLSPYAVTLTASESCEGEEVIGNGGICYEVTGTDCPQEVVECFPLQDESITTVDNLITLGYHMQPYRCLSGILRNKRFELLQTILSSDEVVGADEILLGKLILSTPDSDAKYILDELRNRNLVDPLLNNTQLETFDDIALKLVGWIKKYYPMPTGDQFVFKVLKGEEKVIDFYKDFVSGSVSGNNINLDREGSQYPTIRAGANIDVDVYGYVLICFKEDFGQFKKGQEVPMTAILALYLFNKDRREYIIESTKLIVDVGLMALGIG